MKNKKLQKNSGFTLIETMFAVIIMAFSISVFMNVVANTLFSARYAKNEVVANYLAQEAIDYIRNDRDSMVFFSSDEFSQDTWGSFVNKYSDICTEKDGCELGVLDQEGGVSPILRTCTTDLCSNFYYDPNPEDGSFYTYDLSDKPEKTKTTFSRKIQFTKISDEMVKVKVTIYWKNGSRESSRSLETTLTKWQ